MQRYSKQREAIFENLQSRYDHPTADMVYTDLKRDFPNISLGTVYRNLSLLAEEGVQTTEAFLALTDDTESNILSCLAAKRMGVRKTVAIVENSDYVPMAESLDIGTIINKQTITASHIYQMMLNADVTNVKCLTVSNADVAEFVVAKDAKVTRKQVKDLGLPPNITLGGLVRDGKGQLINGSTQIKEGDRVVVFCIGNIKKIEKYFN